MTQTALSLPETPDALVAGILDAGRRGDDPYPWYHRLRALAPVYRADVFAGRPSWVVSRYAEADAILGNPRLRSDARANQLFDVGPPGARFVELMARTIIFLAPAEHDRVRAMVSRSFTPRAIGRRRVAIAQVVDGLIDGFAARGSADLVEDFGYPLPVHVICEMLGVPHADVPHFMGWAADFARRGDVSGIDAEVVRRGEQATLAFEDYFARLARQRRADPRDDLLSTIVHAEDGGRRLTEREIVATCVILLQAGHGTTADLISTGTLALLRNRGELEWLRANPQGIRTAVEELVRYDTPVQISQRISGTDLELAGATVPAGEVFVVLNGAANRDPAEFPEPDRLDLRRAENFHLGFGRGRHVCLGASLARAELQTAFLALAQRFPKLDLAGEPRWRPSLFLRGLASLPLRW